MRTDSIACYYYSTLGYFSYQVASLRNFSSASNPRAAENQTILTFSFERVLVA